MIEELARRVLNVAVERTVSSLEVILERLDVLPVRVVKWREETVACAA